MLLIASFPQNERTLLNVGEAVADSKTLNVEQKQDYYLLYYTGDSGDELLEITKILFYAQAEIKIYS